MANKERMNERSLLKASLLYYLEIGKKPSPKVIEAKKYELNR